MRTVILIFILAITTFAYSQKKAQEKSQDKVPTIPQHLKSFFEMRKRMMEEMDKVMPGHTFSDSLTSPFDDPFFDQFFNEEDFIKGFHENFKDRLSLQNDFYQSSWEESEQDRILVLKPTNKQVPLDINIKDGLIQITAKSDKNGQNLSFSSSESIPVDVDAKKLKIEQRGDDILVRLPKVVGKTLNKSKIKGGEESEQENKEKLKPLKPSPGDVTI